MAPRHDLYTVDEEVALRDQLERPLSFLELNTDAQSSILIIHGGDGSGADWKKAAPHLSSYHLILPDLPAHGSSLNTHSVVSVSQAADLLADLIRKHGKNGGKARVVGFSLGGRVAVDLISRFPDVVDDSAIVMGYSVFPDRNATTVASFLWLEQQISGATPNWVLRWLTDSDEVPPGRKRSWAYLRRLGALLTTPAWPTPWPARTLIVAAGKSGILPTADNACDAVKLRGIGRECNTETAAYVHPGLRHPWPLQHPELFAELVTAWFQQKPLPEGFVEL